MPWRVAVSSRAQRLCNPFFFFFFFGSEPKILFFFFFFFFSSFHFTAVLARGGLLAACRRCPTSLRGRAGIIPLPSPLPACTPIAPRTVLPVRGTSCPLDFLLFFKQPSCALAEAGAAPEQGWEPRGTPHGIRNRWSRGSENPPELHPGTRWIWWVG